MSMLLEEERDDVLLLTLNRPEARNALSGQLAEMLAAKLESIADRRERARELRAAGLSYSAIARELGVSKSTVVNYLKGYPYRKP
ncbi:MAG: helix-turn-helix domain-containing protein [Proteobacteria bacterium]|nr:helix-turn-helix domain-containing protein [Pseudomonadota bacterium]